MIPPIELSIATKQASTRLALLEKKKSDVRFSSSSVRPADDLSS